MAAAAQPGLTAPQAESGEKPAPVTKQELLELVGAHVPNLRIIELLNQRGIDFSVDDNYLNSLRRAGAAEVVVTALQKVNKSASSVTVQTAPGAQVFLDGNLRGQADAQGMLALQAEAGSHALKVSLAGKQDFQQTITLVAGTPIHVVANLPGATGSLRVTAPAGSTVWLDDLNRGQVDAGGAIVLSGVAPGAHTLKVTARGRMDDSRSVTVTADTETPLSVTLADGVRANPQDGLSYVWISPGTFMMGCSPGDNDCADPEKPAHPVTLRKGYWIGQTDVTVGAYKRYVAAVKAKMPPAAPKVNRGWKDDKFPIVDVTWQDANDYCIWAEGRLPSEAEWEYAARGGNSAPRYGNLPDIAWSRDNSRNETHEVATRAANAYGLDDMLGNVWQWVNDWYNPAYYQKDHGGDPMGPTTGEEKVLRGGSWIVDPKLLRASDRYSQKPAARSDYFGFRCVWRPKPSP